ncbi:MAG TPA: protein kinase [Gemmatimonadales bacterium]|nr:protein kinase [Gemmatimonadales bacterium]
MTDPFPRLVAALSDRYRIERELGQGGMATVYLAEDLKHKRKVAIKILKPELAAVLGAERFVQEITTTAALQHPHILPLFDSGESDGFLWYAMPYIDGETLRSKLDRETQLGIEESVRIATDVASALQYAHTHGVIHRDIKPENILLHDGRPMVADFGIALALSAAAGGRMTETGMSLGTPHYMSPEQATAEKEITARSDVYSLGSVLYEMLTGEPPHMGNSAQQIIMKIIAEDAAPVTKLRKAVPANVAAAVGKSLEKLPADRFESAKAFAEALGNPGFTVTSSGVRTDSGSTRDWRHRAALPLAVATALLVLVAAWGWIRAAARGGPGGSAAIWLAVDPPNGTFGDIPAPALSPDGTQIAFFAPGEGGQRQLWVRSLNAALANAVPSAIANEADLSQQPFWSPDGKSIGYFAAQKLYRVDLDGRAPLKLADAPNPRGGSWGRDGVILFVPASGGLQRLAVAGGSPVPVVDSAAPAGSIDRWPFFLPDGRHFLFLRRSSGKATTVYAGTLDGAEVKPVLEVSSRVEYANGNLYFSRDGALFAQPFDVRQLALTGTAQRVADAVGINGADYRNAAFSVAAGNVVTWSGIPTRLSQLTVLNAAGRLLRTVGPPGHYLSFAVEPGGARVAVERADPRTGIPGIWTIEAASGLTSLIAAPPEGAGTPQWIPGSGDLLYSTFTGNTLVRQSLNSSDVTVIPSPLAWISSVTADGASALIAATNPGTGIDALLVPLTGSGKLTAYLTSPANEEGAVMSPDGGWVAYSSSESDRSEVYVQSFPKPGNKQVVSDGGGASPAWSPDSTELYYLNGDGMLIAARATRLGAALTFSRRTLFRVPPIQALMGVRVPFAPLGDGTFLFNLLSDSVVPRTMRIGLNWEAK